MSTVFTAAVDDNLIQKNPCKAPSVRRPKTEPRKMVPWTVEQVDDVREALTEKYRLLAHLGAGLGLRQGEIFGLSPEDIDIDNAEVRVVRQVKIRSGNKLLFGLPKGRKTRTVPLPDSVLEAINVHMTKFPPRDVTMAWDRLDGAERTVSLLLTTREGGALNRNYFNTRIWRPALEKAGIESKRENGCHALRHFYASTLLDGGESIKALSEHLGHSDPGFTLRTYTHLLPTSNERTRKTIDAVFGHDSDDTSTESEVDDD
ncbi:tyrosine-type recombinase/integrase [Nocardioides sp. Bht2]|uniref:tyrosine-type recombinase/integrase n=1 Tax=Nocardioides sp. Bht2 TaxID=3392297 RepID=UPI0039B6AFA7